MSMQSIYGKPGHLIRRAQQISTALFSEECGAHDLTSVQYAALCAIRETPGLDATRLSSIIAFDRSTLGDVLERLESKGWIIRTPGQADKRIKQLHLSPAGADLLTSVDPAAARVQDRILAPLSPPDRTTLMRLLEQLVDLHHDKTQMTEAVPLEG
jgi:DNA-binding MarR family transcriptional regulator